MLIRQPSNPLWGLIWKYIHLNLFLVSPRFKHRGLKAPMRHNCCLSLLWPLFAMAFNRIKRNLMPYTHRTQQTNMHTRTHTNTHTHICGTHLKQRNQLSPAPLCNTEPASYVTLSQEKTPFSSLLAHLCLRCHVIETQTPELYSTKRTCYRLVRDQTLIVCLVSFCFLAICHS